MDHVREIIQAICRREKVTRVFPNKDSAWRMVGALRAEKHEEWLTSGRCLKTDEFHDWLDRQSDKNTTGAQSQPTRSTLQLA